MAHCSEEEADVASAGIDLTNTQNALDDAQTIFDLAETDLMSCEAEH